VASTQRTTPVPDVVPRIDPELERVKAFARLMDQRFLDPLIGLLLPGAGDILGSLLGVYTVALALRRKLSPVIIARMLTNLALDAAIGLVPFVGDLFDLGFKANTKNVTLLTERAGAGGKATARDWLHVVGATLAFVAIVGLTIFAVVSLFRAIG
jgi:hypothetical protein